MFKLQLYSNSSLCLLSTLVVLDLLLGYMNIKRVDNVRVIRARPWSRGLIIIVMTNVQLFVLRVLYIANNTTF